ncbi:unnamed protein product [Penicillium palitans]
MHAAARDTEGQPAILEPQQSAMGYSASHQLAWVVGRFIRLEGDWLNPEHGSFELEVASSSLGANSFDPEVDLSGAVKVEKGEIRKLQQYADWPFKTFGETQFQVKYVGGDTLGRTSLGEVSLS